MFKFKSVSIKTITISLAVSSLLLAGNVQAHQDDEYLSIVPLILLNVLTLSHHDRNHQHKNRGSARNQQHKNHRQQSRSHSRYNNKRLIKNYR